MSDIATWMPMFWGDYFRDTGHLSASEHGAYLLMIGHYWVTGDPLPDNDEKLRRIARMERAEWKRAKGVLREFFEVRDGVWHNGRAERERCAAESRKQSNTERASNASRKRWGMPVASITDAPSNPPDMLEQSPPPSPSKNSSQSTSLNAASTAAPEQALAPADRVIAAFHTLHAARWPGYGEMRDLGGSASARHLRPQAQALLDAGASVELIEAYLAEQFADWDLNDPPRSLKPLDAQIRRRISEGPPEVAESDTLRMVGDERTRFDALMSFVARGFWLDSWGREPMSKLDAQREMAEMRKRAQDRLAVRKREVA